MDSNDEIGQLMHSMERMQSQLNSAIEVDIQTLVDQAKNGDLSQRIDLTDKTGFFKTLSEGVNDLVTESEQIVGDTSRIFSALSRGDLKQRIEHNFCKI